MRSAPQVRPTLASRMHQRLSQIRPDMGHIPYSALAA